MLVNKRNKFCFLFFWEKLTNWYSVIISVYFWFPTLRKYTKKEMKNDTEEKWLKVPGQDLSWTSAKR